MDEPPNVDSSDLHLTVWPSMTNIPDIRLRSVITPFASISDGFILPFHA
jgi:hypothetical protein